MSVHHSKYSKKKTDEIRYNILMALCDLAPFSGIDISTI